MVASVGKELLDQLDGFIQLRMVTLAFLVVVIYDQILCFEDECSHFWSGTKLTRWNETKILYVIVSNLAMYCCVSLTSNTHRTDI